MADTRLTTPPAWLLFYDRAQELGAFNGRLPSGAAAFARGSFRGSH